MANVMSKESQRQKSSWPVPTSDFDKSFDQNLEGILN